jgi:hypothetical protein
VIRVHANHRNIVVVSKKWPVIADRYQNGRSDDHDASAGDDIVLPGSLLQLDQTPVDKLRSQK